MFYQILVHMQFCVCLSYSIMISVEEYKQLSVLMTGVCKQRQKSRQREGLNDKSILMRFLFRLALFDIHRSCDQQLIAEWASCRSAPLLVSSQAERPAWLHKFLNFFSLRRSLTCVLHNEWKFKWLLGWSTRSHAVAIFLKFYHDFHCFESRLAIAFISTWNLNKLPYILRRQFI